MVAAQFPGWADLEIRRVAEQGWDNRTFHLGPAMSVRLPSAEPYALAVQKEQRWLPVLAPRLPLPIPVPLGHGSPTEEYPHPWSVYGWLPGQPADRSLITDLRRFAAELARFLLALQSVDTDGGPGPGVHNWFRGGPLIRFVGLVDDSLPALPDQSGADQLRRLWRCALDAGPSGSPVWFHGDIAAGNLLVKDGELAAVIDFGTCGVGDPACDLAIAWTLLDSESRPVFLQALGADPALIARARGWVLWKAVSGIAADVADGVEPRVDALYALDQLLTETDSVRADSEV
ncbi:phosphotransferase [Microlunatus sp. Gsoil 973]|nr:phosphotransferase [Microlunatus sp. Gsoil 973]